MVADRVLFLESRPSYFVVRLLRQRLRSRPGFRPPSPDSVFVPRPQETTLSRIFSRILLLALVSGCARADTYTVNFRADTPTSHDVLPYPREQVWAMLPLAYADLSLPAVEAAGGEWELLTPQLRVANQLYGLRNSEFMDCGHDMGSASRENSAEIKLALITRLEQTGPDRTVVRTQMDAYARRRDTASDFVYCRSLGRLEKALAELLEHRLRTGDTTLPAHAPADALKGNVRRDRRP
jgi:hypothetical protein